MVASKQIELGSNMHFGTHLCDLCDGEAEIQTGQVVLRVHYKEVVAGRL
jgi:hypothetical protein